MSYPSHRVWLATNGPGPWLCFGCGQEVSRLGAESIPRWRIQGIVHHHDGNHWNNEPGNLRVMHHGCHVSHHAAQRKAPSIELHVSTTVPQYDKEQIASQLRAAIASGEIGRQLPSLTAIAKDAGVTLNTVQAAVRILKDEGLVYGVKGRGVFVRRQP